MRVRLLLSVLLCLQMTGAAQAQVPERADHPVFASAVTNSVLHLGSESFGVCGEPGAYSPHGNGLGFLQPHKTWHWRMLGQVVGFPFLLEGEFDLCGRADVPTASVPELGTAGPCDAPRGIGGVGRLATRVGGGPGLPMERRAYRISEVAWPATGGVMVVTGKVAAPDGGVPGDLLMLLQRRTAGVCLHKDRDLPAVGSRYPQGGAYAELVGVLALTAPRDAVQGPGCEPWWGQVRRHLGGAGAGVRCPVPEGPLA